METKDIPGRRTGKRQNTSGKSRTSPEPRSRGTRAQSRRRTEIQDSRRKPTRAQARPGVRTKSARGRTGAPVAPPEVVYTPPAPFSRSRFLLRLATAVAVVLALTFGISIFFHVDTILVSGTEKYTPWQVAQASGIQEGDNLLGLSEPKIAGQIRANLPYVNSVRVGIQLPGTVQIEITELDAVYIGTDTSGEQWFITAGGKVVEPAREGDYARILGVELEKPTAGATAQAARKVNTTVPEEETTAVLYTATEQLDTALTIAQYLEMNGLISGIASVDVTDLQDIRIWYGEQFEILLGDARELSYKISCARAALDQLESYRTGQLDVSFSIVSDQPVFTPFDQE